MYSQKCFLNIKSAYYYDFWRSWDTEDWSNDAEISALFTEINNILNKLKFKRVILNCSISKMCCFYYIFD